MNLKRYKRKVYYYETDALGIVHHSNFIRWLEEARLDFFCQLGVDYEKLIEMGIAIIICGVSCDYKKMFKFNEEFEIELKILEMSAAKFSVGYTVFHKNQIHATGKTVHCGVKDNKIISLKKTLPEIYEKMEIFIK
ncbi:MAG: acyl-CoA thioesterase [Firmicutes bacterium]|nr:acyl-CoA thioesterase [Bacillota bacterium]